MLREADNEKAPVSQLSVSAHFDRRYEIEGRYWWRQDDPYSIDPDRYPYSLLTQMTLRLIQKEAAEPGRALDLGAGEGADSIRLARLGYQVTAVEISGVGARKIRRFAEDAGVELEIVNADISTYQPAGEFDLVVCNGVLHYLEHKEPVVKRMQRVTRPGGLNIVSLWSDFTPVPDCHFAIPAFCDAEEGVVQDLYRPWAKELLYFERDRVDYSHSEEQRHSHSHIKLIARKPD